MSTEPKGIMNPTIFFLIAIIFWSSQALAARLLLRAGPIRDGRDRFFRRALRNYGPEALVIGTIAAILTTGLYAAMHQKNIYSQIGKATKAYANREHPGADIILELDRNNDGAADYIVNCG